MGRKGRHKTKGNQKSRECVAGRPWTVKPTSCVTPDKSLNPSEPGVLTQSRHLPTKGCWQKLKKTLPVKHLRSMRTRANVTPNAAAPSPAPHSFQKEKQHLKLRINGCHAYAGKKVRRTMSVNP